MQHQFNVPIAASISRIYRYTNTKFCRKLFHYFSFLLLLGRQSFCSVLYLNLTVTIVLLYYTIFQSLLNCLSMPCDILRGVIRHSFADKVSVFSTFPCSYIIFLSPFFDSETLFFLLTPAFCTLSSFVLINACQL